MKTKKLVRYGLILLGALILFLIIGRSAGWIGAFEGHRVTTEKAEKRTIVETVTASGKVRPVTEVKISPDVSGEIIELNIEEGDYVERGQLLVRINPDLYESALARVEASLNTSRANLANARARTSQAEAQHINAQASYNRNKSLFEDHTISESEYDAARSNYLVAQAEVEAARQSVVGAEFQVKSAEATVKEARESVTFTITLKKIMTVQSQTIEVELEFPAQGEDSELETRDNNFDDLDEDTSSSLFFDLFGDLFGGDE